MKKIKKAEVLSELKEYFENNHNAKWETFKNECQEGYSKVIEQIKKDQGGLCCYCETSFNDAESALRDDFRVEHFHPKSDSNEDKNWDLDWNNLFGCCHGGSDKYVHKGNKFIQEADLRHSDILKGNKNWDDKILNPLIDIPAFPPFFKIDKDGTMTVIEENCEELTEKASNCIDPTMLNLNTNKLKSFREFIINTLTNELMELTTNQGLDISEAVDIMLNTYLTKQDGMYSAFFSTIRSYFGNDAEDFLSNQNFDG